MRYQCTLVGTAPILMCNGAAGLDIRSPIKREMASITAKRGSNRTEADDARLVELECRNSVYLDGNGKLTLPAAAIRAALEAGARKTKQGSAVREGVVIEEPVFRYDEQRYGTTLDEIGKSAQFTVPVVVNRARVLKTRARFDLPWSIEVVIDGDDELVDRPKLLAWLDVAGRRIGIGDWRPATGGGSFGRFEPKAVEPTE